MPRYWGKIVARFLGIAVFAAFLRLAFSQPSEKVYPLPNTSASTPENGSTYNQVFEFAKSWDGSTNKKEELNIFLANNLTSSHEIPLFVSFRWCFLSYSKPRRVILDFAPRNEFGEPFECDEHVFAETVKVYEASCCIESYEQDLLTCSCPKVGPITDVKPIEPGETGLNLHGISNINLALVMLLDFTGSMANVAHAIEQMRASAKELIDVLQPGHRVGVVEYHALPYDDGINTVIHPTTNLQAAKAAIDAISPDQNGDSAVWAAVQHSLDVFNSGCMLGGVETRALVLLSDGRNTTGEGPEAVIEAATKALVAVFAIAFGDDAHVNLPPLEELTYKTGGILYRARNTEELEQAFRWIIRDLTHQYRLQYATSHNPFVIPPDPSPTSTPCCAYITTNYGIYGGNTCKKLKLPLGIMSDVRRGTLGISSEPIIRDASGVGTATLYLRADFIPRDISELLLRFAPETQAASMIISVSEGPGWLTTDWSITPDSLKPDWYHITAPTGTVFSFGDFGILLRIDFPAIPAEINDFRLNVEVDNSIYRSRWFGFDLPNEPTGVSVMVGLPPDPCGLTPSPTGTGSPRATETFGPTRTPTPPPSFFTFLLPGDVPLEVVRIPAGSFVMGSTVTERSRQTNEGPEHLVTIPKDFYLGRYELTQAQWTAVMDATPNWDLGAGPSYPAYYLSWDEICAASTGFIAKLNTWTAAQRQAYRLDTWAFRLPSEAEWEYACRGGTTTRFSFGDSLECDDQCQDCFLSPSTQSRNDYMWYCGNVEPNGAKRVGAKLSNSWAMYDLHGNLWEWCLDWYHDSYTGAPNNGAAWVDPVGTDRVMRGGYWGHTADRCRSANRGWSAPANQAYNLGARVLLGQ